MHTVQKLAASKHYHVFIINNFSVNVIARRTEGTAGKLAEGEGLTNPHVLEGTFLWDFRL